MHRSHRKSSTSRFPGRWRRISSPCDTSTHRSGNGPSSRIRSQRGEQKPSPCGRGLGEGVRGVFDDGNAVARRPHPDPLPRGEGIVPDSATKIIFPRCRIAALSRVMGSAAHDATPELMTEARMKYMLLIYRNEADMLAASKAQAEQTM